MYVYIYIFYETNLFKKYKVSVVKINIVLIDLVYQYCKI